MTGETSIEAVTGRIREALGQAIVDGDRTAFALLVALLTRGHALIEGVPGTGKTLMVRAFALALGVDFRRIQFTPDLMPSDIVGTTVFNQQRSSFAIRNGPIVANVVLADEINRTPPKTQAALLEAMEEGRITIDGTTVGLPQPFMVCATQNPIEYEGTYPLPEAQLDRFMVKVVATYPAPDAERRLLGRVAAGFDARALDVSGIAPVTTAEEVVRLQRDVRNVHLSDDVQQYVYAIVSATRTHPRLALGASPRAGVALLVATQAAAAIGGRDFTTPDDVKSVVPYVLPHRLIVAPEAEIEGVRTSDVLDALLASIPVPRA